MATILTLGTLAVIGVSALVSSIFLKKDVKQTTRTKAAESCFNISADIEARNEGSKKAFYVWVNFDSSQGGDVELLYNGIHVAGWNKFDGGRYTYGPNYTQPFTKGSGEAGIAALPADNGTREINFVYEGWHNGCSPQTQKLNCTVGVNADGFPFLSGDAGCNAKNFSRGGVAPPAQPGGTEASPQKAGAICRYPQKDNDGEIRCYEGNVDTDGVCRYKQGISSGKEVSCEGEYPPKSATTRSETTSSVATKSCVDKIPGLSIPLNCGGKKQYYLKGTAYYSDSKCENKIDDIDGFCTAGSSTCSEAKNYPCSNGKKIYINNNTQIFSDPTCKIENLITNRDNYCGISSPDCRLPGQNISILSGGRMCDSRNPNAVYVCSNGSLVPSSCGNLKCVESEGEEAHCDTSSSNVQPRPAIPGAGQEECLAQDELDRDFKCPDGKRYYKKGPNYYEFVTCTNQINLDSFCGSQTPLPGDGNQPDPPPTKPKCVPNATECTANNAYNKCHSTNDGAGQWLLGGTCEAGTRCQKVNVGENPCIEKNPKITLGDPNVCIDYSAGNCVSDKDVNCYPYNRQGYYVKKNINEGIQENCNYKQGNGISFNAIKGTRFIRYRNAGERENFACKKTVGNSSGGRINDCQSNANACNNYCDYNADQTVTLIIRNSSIKQFFTAPDKNQYKEAKLVAKFMIPKGNYLPEFTYDYKSNSLTDEKNISAQDLSKGDIVVDFKFPTNELLQSLMSGIASNMYINLNFFASYNNTDIPDSLSNTYPINFNFKDDNLFLIVQ